MSRKAKGGAEVAGLNYSIVVSAMDCTGCEVCVEACPDDALEMVTFGDVVQTKTSDWDYAIRLNYLDHADRVEKTSVKGSQFQQPLLEFHGMSRRSTPTPTVSPPPTQTLTQTLTNTSVSIHTHPTLHSKFG